MTVSTNGPAIGRTDQYDAIIIGGGPIGQATAYSLSRTEHGPRSLLSSSSPLATNWAAQLASRASFACPIRSSTWSSWSSSPFRSGMSCKR